MNQRKRERERFIKRTDVPVGTYVCKVCDELVEIGFDLIDELLAGDCIWICSMMTIPTLKRHAVVKRPLGIHPMSYNDKVPKPADEK